MVTGLHLAIPGLRDLADIFPLTFRSITYWVVFFLWGYSQPHAALRELEVRVKITFISCGMGLIPNESSDDV